ncbi:hypothetical protein ACLKA6_000679 [Drosophila palustris]
MELFRRNPVQSSSVIIAKNEMVVFVETLSNEEVLNLAVRGMMSSEPTVQRKDFINPCCCGSIFSPCSARHSSILAAAGSSLQSLLCQDIHQSLLLRDQVFSPCSVRTLINPCCCGIKSSVLALLGHSSILAAAGSSLQSLLCQDIHQSLLLRDQVFSPCSARTLINPCCCGITSSVLALPGHSSILAAAGSSLQSLLCQDIHLSLLLRDHVFSPCSARTFIDPCCCGIQPPVLALPGHSSILAAAGSSLQSLLCQDIHQFLLLRDQVFSPCSARTFINPCCCGIKSSVPALPGHSSVLAAAGSSLQSLLCQDIHRSLLLRDQVFSPCSVRTLIDPCCCGIQPPVLAPSGHSSILAAAGSRLQSLLCQDIHQSLLLRDQVFSPCSPGLHQSLLLRVVFVPALPDIHQFLLLRIKSSVLAPSGHSSILAAAGSRLQSLLCQDIHQSLLLRDQSLLCQDIHQSLLLRINLRPCSVRTFINPCCCGIKSSVLLCQDIHRSLLLRDHSSVLALPGHSSILAAAGSSLQSLLCQDIHQSLLLRDQVFSPCSARTFISSCCCGIKSSVLALSGHSSILAAAGSSLQSLLCQDIHQSLLLRDQVFSPCSARTFIDPCCCGIKSSVLALSGHSSILAAAGSSLQSLLRQDIHRSLLLRDHVFSPCSARTSINPCCCGIQPPVLALSGHSSILAAAGSRLQSLLCQDIHRSLLLRDPASSPCSVRTFIDPCCCGIQPTVLVLPGHSSILAAAGSSLQSLLWQDHQQPLLIRVGHQEVSAAGSVLCPDRETREAEGAEGKDL